MAGVKIVKKKFTENLYKVKSHLTILDIVVIVFLLLSSFFSYKFLKKDFNNAKIYVNNKLVKTLSLSKNQEFSIDKNTIIEIKNKKARIKWL